MTTCHYCNKEALIDGPYTGLWLCAAHYAMECETAPPARCERCGKPTYALPLCRDCASRAVHDGLDAAALVAAVVSGCIRTRAALEIARRLV